MLVITRGIPGSGKSSMAEEWVALSPLGRCRVNSDLIGKMLHGTEHSGIVRWEDAIRRVKLTLIRELLSMGLDVVTDDMHITGKKFAEVVQISDDLGVDVEVWDLRDTPIEVCIHRDMMRGTTGKVEQGRLVGSNEIRRLHALMLEERLSAEVD